MKKCLISLAILFSINAMAKDGSSGCGPGWYLLKKNSILSSSLRVTTNGIFFPTTTLGMTIGTSNCSKHKHFHTEKGLRQLTGILDLMLFYIDYLNSF